ncbi:MAG: signal peptidase I [Synergistaceae bacterium]|nr:signal peptidase I [Synergistaceae bacterium]
MQKPWWRETLETVLWAVGLAFVLRTFVIQAFWIPSGSMIPTLLEQDRVFVLKFLYKAPFNVEIKRGDIIVFAYPLDTKKDYIKRVVALPGEKVALKQGRLYINNKEIPEPYVVNKDNYDFEEVTVPEDSYFCLGDNRPNSQDGRYWGFVPKKNIKGPAKFRYWPLSRIGVVK